MTIVAGASEAANGEPSDDAQAGRLAARAAMDDRHVDDRFTAAFAQAAIVELGRLIDELPKKVKRSVAGGREVAEALNPDPLQGLAEVVQNADDQQASTVRIGLVDGREGPSLVVVHDGARLQLDHLLAMVLPWVSTKRDDDRTTGRFGIGLSTLRSIGDTMQIHCAPYHAELVDGQLRCIEPAESLPGLYEIDPGPPATMVVVPVRPGTALDSAAIRGWLTRWGSAALIFLGSVQRVLFPDPNPDPDDGDGDGDGDLILSLQRTEELVRSFTVAEKGVTARVYEVTDPAAGHRWVRYEAEIPTPSGVARARKKTGATTPLAIAVPLGSAPLGGLLHAGLPLVATGLPWSANAQFDPDASRGHIRDTAWNQSLVELLADFWSAVAADMLTTRPADAWRAVPLQDEVTCKSDAWLEGALGNALVVGARATLAERASMVIRDRLVPLNDLVYPAPSLRELVSDDDMSRLAPNKVVLPKDVCPDDGRWWRVLNELELGDGIQIERALDLLTEGAIDGRPANWFIAVASRAVAAGAGEALRTRPSVVLADGCRVLPPWPGEDARLLVPADAPESLEESAGLTLRIHPAFLQDTEDARVVLGWLTEQGAYVEERLPTESAIIRVARARTASLPLGDSALVSFRDLFATLTTEAQERHGRAVGQVVVVDAETWDHAGNALLEKATPGACYQPRVIDHDPDGWPVAAAKATGIRWVARRYAPLLKSESGRAGVGAQRFFTLLGAERAPLLAPHPQGEAKYASDRRRAVPRWVTGTPPTRSEELRHVETDKPYVLEDWVSPDLDLVLASIRTDPSRERRRRRAAALLATLQRAWERLYADRAQSPVVEASYGWHLTGTKVTSWWLARLRDEEWLPDAEGRLCAPRNLVLPSRANRAVYGDDGHYADQLLTVGIRDELVSALGITGDPQVTDVLSTLRAIRTGAPDVSVSHDQAAWDEAATRAYPMYQLLAGWLSPARRRRMNLSRAELRRWFSSGAGLVLTDQGWRTPEVVFSGPPVFGDLRAFAPYSSALETLWRELAVRTPDVADCAAVLREVASRATRQGDEAIELQSLRLLQGKLRDGQAPSVLRRLPLRTESGHSGKRPMYAVDDPALADVLGHVARVWQPGGDVAQFRELFGPLNVTQLTANDFRVVSYESSSESSQDSALAQAALTLLLDELIRDDAELAASSGPASTLTTELTVLFHRRLRLGVELAGRPQVIDTVSFLDADAGVLHVQEGEEVGDWAVGGRAIASLFEGDRRKVAYAWAAMWSRAVAGDRRKALVLDEQKAAARSAELLRLADDIESGSRDAARNASRNGRRSIPAQNKSEPPPPAPRLLIDLGGLSDAVVKGRIASAGGKAAAAASGDPSPQLRQPVGRQTPPVRPPGSGPAGYTDKEREDVGVALLQFLLQQTGEELQDVRDQILVGADAVDSRGRFYELKVFAREAQNSVSLQASEIARARDHDFYLVIVSNVERGVGTSEVRIIADPLHRLAEVTDGSITLSGIHQAEALVYDISLPSSPRDP